jgi:3-hydroxyisobutyrate dehydrogenase-like beta-hydroxyacid dehydrogenase
MKTNVTVVGTGQMGSALARALIARGFTITVWNRSLERAEPLAELGARVAGSIVDAILASDIVIFCVIDVKAATTLIDGPGVRMALDRRVLLQLSSGTPADMTLQSELVTASGGRFIAGGILCFPSLIGQPNSLIVYAGDLSGYERHQSVLGALSGAARFLGPDPATAVIAYFALGTFTIGVQGLYYETGAAAAKVGVDALTYYALMRLCVDQLGVAISDGVQRIRTNHYTDSQASIELSGAYMRDVCAAFSALGVATPMSAALLDQLALGSRRGHGDQDVSALMVALSGGASNSRAG